MSRNHRTALRSVSALVAAGAAIAMFGATPAHAASTVGGQISSSEVLARAQSWVNEGVPYNQDGFKTDSNGTYREDCSGFVSMAWHLSTAGNNDGLTTQTLPSVSSQISFSQLQPGDALDYTAEHTFLFAGWTNQSSGSFTYYADSNTDDPTHGPTSANINDSSLEGWPTSDYEALRYNNITDRTGQVGIGVWRPSDNTFYLSDSTTSGTTNASQVFGSSSSGMIPITGDWDGSGKTGIGMYDPSTSTFYLHDGDKSGGENDYTLHFGTGGAGLLPIVGDWNGNGTDTVGVWNPTNHTVYEATSNTDATTALTQVFGGTGMLPIAGDWDGSGQSGFGMYDPSTSTFYLHDGDKSGGENDYTLHFGSGGTGMLPIVGDWTGNGTDTVGVYAPSDDTFFYATSNTNAATAGSQIFGTGGDDPVVGDWNGQ